MNSNTTLADIRHMAVYGDDEHKTMAAEQCMCGDDIQLESLDHAAQLAADALDYLMEHGYAGDDDISDVPESDMILALRAASHDNEGMANMDGCQKHWRAVDDLTDAECLDVEQHIAAASYDRDVTGCRVMEWCAEAAHGECDGTPRDYVRLYLSHLGTGLEY